MEINFPKNEKKILKFWRDNQVFKKSILQRKKAPDFVFFEGPPTANAKPGIHHVLSRIYKDIICRYKTMQGFKVLRKAGWDSHGLPVELEIEKKLGLRNKKDIEKYGIAKFNKLCKQSVWNYKKDWEDLTERIAFWLDMENPYITYDMNYIESVWWILKEIYKKGLIYQDYKVVPYCPRCGTSLSSHEVSLGYERIEEPAIYVKFKLKSDTSLLVWTTTPWTLPGNVAVAVNPNLTYVKVKADNEYLILAKERMKASGVEGKIVEEIKGKGLIGLEYKPLYEFMKPDKKAWFVVAGNFVSLKEGTGLVHIAPAFGEEDMELGKEKNLPVLITVDEAGCFTPEVKPWREMFVKKADPLIVEDLKKRDLLFKKESYGHDYPFCWRCNSPLLYYAKQSWFINVKNVRKSLLVNSQKINWIPAHLKRGRFGEWLREIKDWAFSRERYWGTPLPVWQCKKCGQVEIIGSKKDLLLKKFSSNKYLILRHGESDRNVKNLVSCWPEKGKCSLTKRGRRQIAKVAKKIKKAKIDLIFSSDLLRTRQTAEIVERETGIKPKFDKRLRELDMGDLNGKSVKIAGRFWDPERKLKKIDYYLKRFKVRAPKGENYLDAQKRMYSFLKDTDKKYQNKTVLIISHELPITVLAGTNEGLSQKQMVEKRMKLYIKTGELRKLKFSNLPYNENMELDFHRPYIDKVKFYCPRCQSLMERTPEVIDCWFDSGSMPFAQYHYPFENQKLQKEQFPADYISEAIDQTRGWFYTLLAISTLLEKGPAYKNAISLGHVLDEKGDKMSKSKGNVVEPNSIIEKYGADATRWYFYTVNQPGDAKLFSEKDIDQSLKKFILTLWNALVFFKTYNNKSKNQKPKTKNTLDKWVVSKLNNLIQEVTQRLDKYDITGAARAIENFTIENLSQWYIRRSRKRFQRPGSKKELEEASNILNYVLLTLSKIIAPFVPFISEHTYKEITKIRGQKSVHLEVWPKADKKMINNRLEEKMVRVRQIVNLGLRERARLGFKVRQPLREITVGKLADGLEKELKDLIKEELNIKSFRYELKIKEKIKLDENITPELKKEGEKRDILRYVKELRKELKLPPQYIVGGITSTISIDTYMPAHELKKEMGANKIIKVETKEEMTNVDKKKEIELGGKKHYIGIKKN